jgi:hypothetical protein
MTVRNGHRILSLLSLLLFLFGTSGDALSGHLCPHHDGVVLAASQTAQHGHHESDASNSDKEHQGCTCIGRCVQNSSVALPAIADATPALAAETADVTEFQNHGRAPVQPRYLLPFATAPPVIA